MILILGAFFTAFIFIAAGAEIAARHFDKTRGWDE